MANAENISSKVSKSTLKILANIFISFTGAGVLGLPFAFKIGGVVEGTILMLLVGTLSVKAMLMLISCKYTVMKLPEYFEENNKEFCLIKEDDESLKNLTSDHEIRSVKSGSNEVSYGDIGYYSFGRSGRFIVEIVIVVSQVGFSCAYLIFISENLSSYIPALHLIHWLCILLPPLYLLTLCRHLSSLAMSSILAQCSTVLAFVVVFWFDFQHIYHVHITPQAYHVTGIPFFLCIAIYSYEGAGMILSLEGSVAVSMRYRFKKLFIVSLCIVTTIYITFGISGYMSFGSETKEIITLNLPMQKGSLDVVMLVKSCLSVTLLFTYPIMMFPVTQILESYLITSPTNSLWKGNILRLVLVLITGAVVLSVPNFANLMALVGATCCTLLAFILPGLFHLTLNKKTISKLHYLFDIFLILFGALGAAIGTVDAFKRLVQYHIEKHANNSTIFLPTQTNTLSPYV